MAKGIVFINQATGYLTIDIVNHFVNDFDNVVLITGSVRIQDTELNPKIKIEYIARYDRGNNLRKAVSWLKGTIKIFFLLRFRYNYFDKFYFTVPPTAYLMAPWFREKFSILVFDLYPEALRANGFSVNGLLYRWWSSRNRKIFGKSHRIFTLSNSMKSGIEKYSSGRDAIVIPNWSCFSHLEPIPKAINKILEREELTGKFIVQYSGNIGVTHNVETLIEVAGSLSGEDEIVFQIIGRGERTNEISRIINENHLSNCILLPFRDDNELYESLCAADLAVIILDDRTPEVSIPSKIYNIMSAALPVMAIASDSSGLAELVCSHNIGKVFDKGDILGMKNYILDLKNNNERWKIFSSNSFKTSQMYTRDNARMYLQRYLE
jgi:glycosyltransferase involved in cell wall biosynthesis